MLITHSRTHFRVDVAIGKFEIRIPRRVNELRSSVCERFPKFLSIRIGHSRHVLEMHTDKLMINFIIYQRSTAPAGVI